ncbi:MAG: trypsin-like peptidase domain-containing protein [Planctomycetaceae bacterium]|nr:trypsin-like peptidase domain-containing protein [Planctomycetaceae bacterium]
MMNDRPSTVRRLAIEMPVAARVSALAVGCLLLCYCFSVASASELRETPIVKAVQKARSAVVNIRGEKTIGAAAGQTPTPDAGRRVNGMGTGVIIDSRGYIITNHHVVDGVREIMVTLADGRRHIAKVVARDLDTDLAIIKIDAKTSLPAIAIGTSSDLMTGETVIAVGNAYGYEHTVTRGIVSALHRAVQVSDAQFYDDLIQTDASINPGNSGGPLLNIDGEMIGINVAVRAGAQGIGFAIPVDRAMAVTVGLLASCNANKARIGVASATDVSPTTQGMVVGAVESQSPASQAGLVAGDVVVAVDNAEIHRPLDFQRAMIDRKPGDMVRLSIQRSGNPLNLSLTLGKGAEKIAASEQPAWESLGVELKAIPTDEFRKTHQTRYRGGLTVTAVRPNSPAASQGIAPGDVLVGMHLWETVTLDNVAYILKRPDFTSMGPVKFFILRGDETLYGFFPAPPTETAQR